MLVISFPSTEKPVGTLCNLYTDAKTYHFHLNAREYMSMPSYTSKHDKLHTTIDYSE
jgi:hypothetical protein